MAIVLMEGFDLYSNASDLALRYTGSSFALSTSAGRFGGGAWQFGGVGLLYMPLPAGLGLELWAGFAYNMSDTRTTDCPVCSFLSGAGIEAQVSYKPSTGEMRLWRGNQSNVLASVTVSINDGNYHWWDVHYLYDGSAGVFEVWIDGNQVVSVAGVNTTHNGGQTSLVTFALGSVTLNTALGYIDDVVVVDTTGSVNNGRIGDSRIETIVPTSDAGPNQGTPSTGTDHFAVVDEPQFNTSDYLTMVNTPGQEELFGMGNLAGTPVVIAGVQVIMVAQNDSAGAGSLKPVISSSGTVASGASVSLGTAWSLLSGIFEQDPHTSAAWTAVGINALDAGFEVT